MEETVICSSCRGQGHRRRTHRDCPMNPARSNPSVETVGCLSCGGEGHKRRTHRNCPLNPINAADAATAPEDVHCPFCYKVGHNKTNHWNCARNPLNLEDDRIARNPDLPEVARQSIGSMDAVYSTCGASMWIGERKSTSSVSVPIFQMCCAEGESLLATSRTLPPIIADLLTRNDAIAKEFKHDIRSYNSALSFTSMNADLDRRCANEEHGAYAFRIHGNVHHRISPELIPNPNNAIQRPRFAQIVHIKL